MSVVLGFNRAAIYPGLIVHVRTSSLLGSTLRWSMTRWLRRQYPDCENQVWGNHDAMLVGIEGCVVGVGEAIPSGNMVTSLERYNWLMQEGQYQCRVYKVADQSKAVHAQAAANWMKHIRGTSYDMLAFPRLAFKSLVWSFWDKPVGLKKARYCSESVQESWFEYPPHIDVLGDRNATPMHTEMRAGLLPQKPWQRITLEDVTDEMLQVV